MPMYEYRCTSCGDQIVTTTRIEELHDLKDTAHDEVTWVVPEEVGFGSFCGPLKRTWSVGFQIKSTDWGH